MIKVALTGNIGSGKSTVSRIFNSLNVPVFHADMEAKLFYTEDEVKETVRKTFGKKVFNASNEVDFKALAEVIFNDKQALTKINRIIHPLTLKKYKRWLSKHKDSNYTIHESAILFENDLQHHFDKIINVTAPLEVRLKRVIERDNLSPDNILDRMKNQMTEAEKNSLADYVIENDGNRFLIPQVIDINNKLLKV